MSEYEPQTGDLVSIRAKVIATLGDNGYGLTLIDRPAPPLPTEPGTTGVATVRGVPGVRVMRTDHFVLTPWFSAWSVKYGDARSQSWHADSDLADFTPDPQPSGAVTAEPTADTGPAPVDLDARLAPWTCGGAA